MVEKVPELSVIIPARNEMFLTRTVEGLLLSIKGDTEIIVILDGYWPDPPIADDPKVIIIHYTTPIGQRAAFNIGARLSKAKNLMKLDAHCIMDEGFDVKLVADADKDTVVTPRLYNLHAFDRVCNKCGERVYQGPTDIKKVPSFLLQESKHPQLEFNKAIIEETKDAVCAYKLNMAFYEVAGKQGLETLEKTIQYIPKHILIILEGKRNDIGNTALKYAQSLFETWKADAVTINPYLGKDGVNPFLE